MKLIKQCIGFLLLFPLMGLAASEKISDWGMEPNGELRVVVGSETLFVSPADESAYFQALMAARKQWPVEVMNGHIVVDTAAIAPSDVGSLAVCSTPSCTFTGVTREIYGCLLDQMKDMILNPPPPATGSGNITSWPDTNANSGVVTFTMPPFVGPFSINVTLNEPTLYGQITQKPTKPVLIPDQVIWGYVESELNWCKANH